MNCNPTNMILLKSVDDIQIKLLFHSNNKFNKLF